MSEIRNDGTRKTIIKYLLFIFFVICCAFFISLSIKSAVGLGAWDALYQSLSIITGIKVGTMTIILNFIFLIGQVFIYKKDFKLKQLLQIPLSLVLGLVINFFLYNLLDKIEFNNYFLRLTMLVLSFIGLSFFLSGILTLNLVTFSLEGFCFAISDVKNIDYGKVRFTADGVFLILVLILTYVFKLDLTLREGTIISMFLVGPLTGFFMKIIRPIFLKAGLIT